MDKRFPYELQISCVVSADVVKFNESSRGATCKKLRIPVVTEAYVSDSATRGVKQVCHIYHV